MAACEQAPDRTPGEAVAAPKPDTRGAMSVERALARRRSVRDFVDRPLTEAQIAQLAWAAQGVTEPSRGFRTAPSAGALYPIELYVVTAEGVARYLPRKHAFEQVATGDRRQALAEVAVNQTWVARAPATFIVAAVYERTTRKYGERGIRYATIEVGHVCQNISLQAVALGLGSVSVGAFQDDAVRKLLGAPVNHRPLCLVCVGQPRVGP
jgi:SagB-type dehydrogenase family enzyme